MEALLQSEDEFLEDSGKFIASQKEPDLEVSKIISEKIWEIM